MTAHTTSATSSNRPFATLAAVRATVCVVDENDRGLLITRRMIRTPGILHAENTKHAVPLWERIDGGKREVR